MRILEIWRHKFSSGRLILCGTFFQTKYWEKLLNSIGIISAHYIAQNETHGMQKDIPAKRPGVISQLWMAMQQKHYALDWGCYLTTASLWVKQSRTVQLCRYLWKELGKFSTTMESWELVQASSCDVTTSLLFFPSFFFPSLFNILHPRESLWL